MRKSNRARHASALPKQFHVKKKPGNAFSLEVIQNHGKLFYAYQKCIGNRTLKAAYLPAQIRWYTVALWVVTLLPPAVLLVLNFSDWRWSWAAPFIQLAITTGLFFPLATFCLHRGLPEAYTAAGIKGDITMQPKQLHGPLIRLMWFYDLVSENTNITHQQIKMCIELVELRGKDSPPSPTSYFRHPLTLLVLGIVAFTLNAKISQWFQSAANAEMVLVTVGGLAAWILGLGGMLYSWRYSELEVRWSFLRALRWLELTMRSR
jgi:hypothetical protein